jgi:aminoglycoside phosphotransferase family enzyme/predicted kinase
MNETVPDLIVGLLRPDAYPHSVEEIRLIETHISWVFLTGSYAYKVKKPVDFGFLDFSTLARREWFCHEELRLNRRLAPDLYLDVCAICGSPEAPRIDGRGPVLEYAVRMRQFPPDALLSNLAATGTLETRHIDRLAELVATFHGSIPRSTTHDPYGTPDCIRKATLDNLSHIAPAILSDPDRILLQSLHGRAERDHEQLDAFFRRRKEEGFVRECHGDLHLANIALIDDTPTPFDAIEFNPELRWIDVISELAFLAMDLEVRELCRYSARLLNRYLAITGDYSAMALWGYYRRYRAMVRAKIAALTWAGTADPDRKASMVADFHRYLRYAQSLLTEKRPWLCILHGVSGSGKSWLAREISESLYAIVVRSDVERKRLAANLSLVGDRLYDREFTEKTYETLMQRARGLIESNLPVLLDATFLAVHHRDRARKLAEEVGARFLILSLEAPIETLYARIEARRRAAGDPSDADLRILERQLASFQPLREEEMPFVAKYRAGSPLGPWLERLRDRLEEAPDAVTNRQ